MRWFSVNYRKVAVRIRLKGFLFSVTLALGLLSCMGLGSGGDPETGPSGGLRIGNLKSIYIDSKAHPAEKAMAEMLRARLEELYGVTPKIRAGLAGMREPGILVGRELAIAAGIVNEQELEAIKYDGYVIRTSGNHVAIAGYGPEGNTYAAYAFLRRIGLKVYPWHLNDGLEVFAPLEDGLLKPFSVSSKPFFAHRFLLPHLDRGRFGGSIWEYSLGDLRFAHDHEYFRDRGWLSWDHTAAYLVPEALYGDGHPAYFGTKPEWQRRSSKPTPNLRVSLCMCEPDVDRIAAERALQWIELQPERRYFAITDGDVAESRCPRCARTDPIPDYYTDRLLRWVNSVAGTVKRKYPDKTLLTFAYQSTVKPPLETGLAPNVLVMYAPWYWTSRGSSAVSFASPLNTTAMREFVGWSQRFPGQIGVYDYPHDWVHGMVERIKFYAKNEVPWIHLNGARGDRFQWVTSQLLWDPFLDAGELEDEFVEVFYGPAAEPMGQYLRLRQEAIEQTSQYTTVIFGTQEFLQQAVPLLDRAAAIAETQDLRTQTRIFEGVAEGLHGILRDGLKADLDSHDLKRIFLQYVELQRAIFQNSERLGVGDHIMRRMTDMVAGDLSALLDRKNPKAINEGYTRTARQAMLERSVQEFKERQMGLRRQTALFPPGPARSVATQFAESSKSGTWRVTASQADLVSLPEVAKLERAVGPDLTGNEVKVPLSRLPVLPRGNIEIHAGRFHVEHVFDPPLNVEGLPFLDIHLYASRSVPVTVYINERDRLRSDVNLQSGEQIVRIDLRNYRDSRFDLDEWKGKIEDIGFDFWPQDNFYPYPKAQDTDVIVLGLEMKNHGPAPASLPYQGKALWMSHFRPNIPHGSSSAFKDIAARYRAHTGRKTDYDAILGDYRVRWISERYRSFTEQRIVSPVFAIVTGRSQVHEISEAAPIMQKSLEQTFGVRLPIDPPELVSGPDAANVIVIGRDAALASGAVTRKELEKAGQGGFVIRAQDGLVVIAGVDAEGTVAGVIRYLEDHGIHPRIPRGNNDMADKPELFLHELYLLDWPYFDNAPIRCEALQAQSLGTIQGTVGMSTSDLAITKDLASRIKDHARKGGKELPSDAVAGAKTSPLSCYVAAGLSWNPFADTSRLIDSFTRAAGLGQP